MKYTDEELLNQLRNHPKRPQYDDWKGAGENRAQAQVFAKRFGQWTNAMKLAGYRVKEYKKKYTKEQLIQALRTAGSMSQDMYNIYARDNNLPSAVTMVTHFGSWLEALEAAGVDDLGKGVKPNEPTTTYLVHFIDEDFFKVGITQRPLHLRFGGYPKYDTILTHTFATLKEALEVEKLWLKNTEEYRYTPNQFKAYQGGHTECFIY